MYKDRKICPIIRSKSINQNQLITVTAIKIRRLAHKISHYNYILYAQKIQ